MIVMRCINNKSISYYKEAIEIFNIDDILKVKAINKENAILLLTARERFKEVSNNYIEKIEKVAKALETGIERR